MAEVTRIVTTAFNLETKKSNIIADEKTKWFSPNSKNPNFQVQELFYSEDNPVSLQTRHLNKPFTFNLPERAMRFLKLRMPTKAEMVADLVQAGEAIPEDWGKFDLHRIDSIDYIYILSGNITCFVSEEKFDLSPGDLLVQIGAEHTWLNDHDEPCYAFCVTVGTPMPQGAERAETIF